MNQNSGHQLTTEQANSLEKVSVELLLEVNTRVRSVVSVAPQDSILVAAQKLKEANIGLLIVREGEKMVGVLSERDVVQRWMCGSKYPNPVPVSEVMSTNVETVTAFDTVYDCYLRFVARSCRHLPIVDAAGAVIGILSLRDDFLRN